ncbi:MAG: SMI1/KNR4 family protein [Lachnospiraceae bacterium]|nr:SMI1/KNR4 family protein [Lachnospiraceae bacterium]
MTGIEKFVEKMKQKYGRNVVVKMKNCNKETLIQVPQPLVELYSYYDSIEFPFGRIDSIKNAVKHSNTAEPFKSKGWFCFGFDGYFSFWLCSYSPDSEGLWITSWDHDMEDEIECVYSNLVEFLQDMEEEYEENREEE